MKDDNKSKEPMVPENVDHDDVEMEIEELKAEIERMIKGLNEISPEEKAIIVKIRKVLDDHELKYSYDDKEPKHIGLGFGMDNKPFKIHIILQNGKVIFKLCFPFRVQTNAYPLMCMFMSSFNGDKAFSILNLDYDDGELTMEYSYMLEQSAQFDEKYFWVYMTSLIHPALEIYTKAAHLSMGMVSSKDRRLYKKLLEMAIETINGDFDDDNVSYGTEAIRSHFHPDLSCLLRPEATGVDEDASGSDEEDSVPEFIRDMRRSRRMPNAEEFMCLYEQTEEGSEEESKDQVKEDDSVLSMFAKRDEDKEVGGNEDE